MNVNSIFKHALLEMDEDPADISDYDEKFKMYLNMGYQLIVRKYYKPRETVVVRTDKEGYLNLYGYNVEEIVAMQTVDGRPVTYEVHPDGRNEYQTSARGQKVAVVYVTSYPPLVDELDEPNLPEHVHYALVNYICYKHLSSGNLAKQSRAQYYLQSFYEAMGMLKPTGSGSVKTYTNFYAATE